LYTNHISTLIIYTGRVIYSCTNASRPGVLIYRHRPYDLQAPTSDIDPIARFTLPVWTYV